MSQLIHYQDIEVCQEEQIVLRNVNLDIRSGEMVYLLGRVGSGKSSLMKTFYAELPVQGVEASVLGYNLLTIKRKHVPYLRRKVGVVFQDFQLLVDRNVEENLMFVLKATGWKKENIDKRIDEVLESVGMTDAKHKMPYQLSGGEQQRIAIARSILNNPKVILADEPTGNLDPETADNIVALLKEITATGTAVVMTTHNIPMLDKFPGIVYQCQDRKLEDITEQYR